ncbi:methyl-accepting chemotaxis protein [Sporosarcina soli]|uniref:Methyl-accepting chemotaxis protein n=2 Tax=Sporosarcina soli TaxID=334736 RepID=A0ABW0TN99_9BACL
MHSKLASLKQSMRDFQKTYPEDACLVLGDHEGTLLEYLPGKTIDIKVKIGDKILSNSVTMKALREGRLLREENDSSNFGFPYISLAQPIFDGREVIGVLSALISYEKVSTLRSGATNLAAAVQEMSAMTEMMTNAMTDVTTQLQALSERSGTVRQDISKIIDVLSLVKNIARQSNILGLNASIEAARAGEQGKGFSVVAHEIRKMADHSNESATKIETQLDIITNAIDEMNVSTSHIASFTEEHHASMEELNGTYSKLNQLADELLQTSTID